MATKFDDFLKENKIDSRRVLVASRRLERLRPEDRQLRLAQRKARSSESSEEDKGTERTKPRSGRPVTPRLLSAASQGGKVSGPAKTRLLRAVNRILEQRKQEPVDLRALF